MQATGYSLAIVGTMIGAAEYLRRGQTHLPLAPAIPDPVLALSGLVLRKGQAILLLFATLMFGGAAAMLRGVPDGQERGAAHVHVKYPLVIPLGGLPAPGSGAGKTVRADDDEVTRPLACDSEDLRRGCADAHLVLQRRE